MNLNSSAWTIFHRTFRSKWFDLFTFVNSIICHSLRISITGIVNMNWSLKLHIHEDELVAGVWAYYKAGEEGERGFIGNFGDNHVVMPYEYDGLLSFT